jgi:hypothetical protein
VAGRIGTLAGLSLLALGGSVRGAEPAATAHAAAEPVPSAELLLFLAEFRDAEGNEVDPVAIAEQSERGYGGKHAAKAGTAKAQRNERDDESDAERKR